MSEGGDRFTVALGTEGPRYEARAGLTILQSARAAGLVLASSCRIGTCRTCICRMSSGRVRYAIEWPGLSADEKAEGYVLPCVAMPETALVLEGVKFVALPALGPSAG